MYWTAAQFWCILFQIVPEFKNVSRFPSIMSSFSMTKTCFFSVHAPIFLLLHFSVLSNGKYGQKPSPFITFAVYSSFGRVAAQLNSTTESSELHSWPRSTVWLDSPQLFPVHTLPPNIMSKTPYPFQDQFHKQEFHRQLQPAWQITPFHNSENSLSNPFPCIFWVSSFPNFPVTSTCIGFSAFSTNSRLLNSSIPFSSDLHRTTVQGPIVATPDSCSLYLARFCAADQWFYCGGGNAAQARVRILQRLVSSLIFGPVPIFLV